MVRQKNVTKLLGVVFLALSLPCFASLQVWSAEIYFNDFSSSQVESEWSTTPGTKTITTSPNGEKFFGTNSTWGFTNDTATLSLSSLLNHTSLTLSLDLYIIRSWDGNSTTNGPDHWSLAIQGGTTLLDTTFASHDPRRQSYPGNYLTDNDPHTGRTDFNTLDYEDCSGTNDVYHLIYTFPHTAANVAIDFKAWGLQEINDESWGLDNVRVEYAPVPLPGSVLLLETGLLGLAGWRRFRKG